MAKSAALISSLLIVTLIPSPARCQDVPGRYVWPIAGHTNISAGFCDYRIRHYHGGIDISTGGQEGLPVRAADSGWVMRVSTSYWGYGKAVYVQMTDGHIAVYGHLSELSPKIWAYVEDKQYASRRYQQNLFPGGGEIPVARGEVIGKSGQTGSGPPHLHFEIRTKDNRPLNPLNGFFDKPDARRPVIRKITILPPPPFLLQTRSATINGRSAPLSLSVEGTRLSAKPVVTGAVGIAVLADDHIDGPNWTVSPHQFRLFVNDTLVGEVSYDSINYDETRQIELERQYDHRGGISPRAVNLFRHSGNTLWHYRDFPYDGWLGIDSGLKRGHNEIRIEAVDLGGNVDAVSFTLRADEGEADSIPTIGQPIRAEDGGRVKSEDGNVIVSLAPGDLYASASMALESSPLPAKSGAKSLTPLYTLRPADLPLARDISLSIAVPGIELPARQLGIYRYRNSSWILEGNEKDREWDAIQAKISATGSFAVLADQTPPVIANVKPAKGAIMADRRPQVRFHVTDNLSGIGSDEDLQMTVDGQWLPVEYDPDLDLAKARPRTELTPGEHRIEITARDRAGNEATFTRLIRVSH